MTALDFTQPAVDPDQRVRDRLEDEVIGVVRDADNNSHRSVQTALGPSEVWMDCLRRQAYRVAGWPTINHTADPWAAIVGTATHTWLADAFRRHNAVLGQPRWAIEVRLEIRPGMHGHGDLFDLLYGDAIDHKVMGENSMGKIRRGQVSEQYRRQLHIYGLGWERLGVPPKRVILLAYPRGGLLVGLRAVPEPYDRRLAIEALDRLDRLVDLVRSLDVHNNPQRLALIPPTPGHICSYCPFWNPSAIDPGQGCRGMLDK